MNRIFSTIVCGLALSSLASSALAVTGPVTGRVHTSSKPKPSKWIKQSLTFDIHKGGGCNQRIHVKVTGEERYTDVSEDVTKTEARHETATLTNVKTKTRVKVSTNGIFLFTLSPLSARNVSATINAKGGSLIYGGGMKGILYVQGSVKYRTTFDDEGYSQTAVLASKGTTTELCTVLKAKPVVGKDE